MMHYHVHTSCQDLAFDDPHLPGSHLRSFGHSWPWARGVPVYRAKSKGTQVVVGSTPVPKHARAFAALCSWQSFCNAFCNAIYLIEAAAKWRRGAWQHALSSAALLAPNSKAQMLLAPMACNCQSPRAGLHGCGLLWLLSGALCTQHQGNHAMHSSLPCHSMYLLWSLP